MIKVMSIMVAGVDTKRELDMNEEIMRNMNAYLSEGFSIILMSDFTSGTKGFITYTLSDNPENDVYLSAE